MMKEMVKLHPARFLGQTGAPTKTQDEIHRK